MLDRVLRRLTILSVRHRGAIRSIGAALLWAVILCIFVPAVRAGMAITNWTLQITAYGETNGDLVVNTSPVFPFSGSQFVTNIENRLLDDCTSFVSYTHSGSVAYNFSLMGTTRVLQTVLSGNLPARQDWCTNFWGPRILYGQVIIFSTDEAFYYTLRGHISCPSLGPNWVLLLRASLDTNYSDYQQPGNTGSQAIPLVADLTNYYSGALSGILPPGSHTFICTEGISADFEAAGDSSDSGEIVLGLTPVKGPLGIYLTGSITLDGSVELTFQSRPGLNSTILATTNLALPLSSWTVLGPATETLAGLYQFVDSDAANNQPRFYRVRSP